MSLSHAVTLVCPRNELFLIPFEVRAAFYRLRKDSAHLPVEETELRQSVQSRTGVSTKHFYSMNYRGTGLVFCLSVCQFQKPFEICVDVRDLNMPRAGSRSLFSIRDFFFLFDVPPHLPSMLQLVRKGQPTQGHVIMFPH